MTVERVDGFVLSGGSAFGLDAAGGAMASCRARSRLPVGAVRVPIVPGATSSTSLNGGDKGWGRMPPYWEMGYAAAARAGDTLRARHRRRGFGATTYDLKGGLGSASATTSARLSGRGARRLQRRRPDDAGRGPSSGPRPIEGSGEFGGLGPGPHSRAASDEHSSRSLQERRPANTTSPWWRPTRR